MDRAKAQKNQHKTSMRVDRVVASELLPQGSRSKRIKPGADAYTGRGVHGDAVLRDKANDGRTASERIRSKPQADSAVVTPNGNKCDICEAVFKQKRLWTQGISVFVERNGDRAAEPGMVNGHNVYTAASRVRVSGSSDGLVQQIRVVMGVIGNDGDGVLCIGAGMGVETRQTGNLQ